VLDTDDKFQIGGAGIDELQLKNELDYATASSHSVTIRCTDTYEKTYDKVFTITVTEDVYTSTKYCRLNNGVANEYFKSSGVHGTAMNFSGNFTYSIWLKMGVNTSFAITTMYDGSFAKFFIYNYDTSGNRLRFHIYDTSGNGKQFYVNTPTITPSDDTWHQYIFTYSLNTPVVYYDNTVQTLTYIVNQTLGSTLRSSNDLIIFSKASAPNAPLNGSFDQITFWDTNMNTSQVNELWNSGSPNYNIKKHSLYSNLISWYKTDSLVANQLVDANATLNLDGFNVDSSNFIDYY